MGEFCEIPDTTNQSWDGARSQYLYETVNYHQKPFFMCETHYRVSITSSFWQYLVEICAVKLIFYQLVHGLGRDANSSFQ